MQLDPDLKPFIEKLKLAFDPHPHTLTAPEFRALMQRLGSAGNPAVRPDGIQVSDEYLDVNSRSILVRIYRPVGPGAIPGLLYMHGGGWTVGSVDSHDLITADIAKEVGIAVVSLNYSLAPEHPYPCALQEVEAAADWLIGNAARLGIDASRLGIGGDSAGANLAAAFCLKRRDQGLGDPFRLQLLVYPAVDTDLTRQSFITNHDAPFLDTPLMKWFLDHYLQGELDTNDPYAMPMKADSFVGLPAAYIATAEYDPLLDEGAALAARMIADGVNVTYRRAPGLMHGFLRVREISRLAAIECQAMYRWLRESLSLHST